MSGGTGGLPRVLLVEDDGRLAEAMERMLRKDWVVTLASDGIVAKQYLEISEDYDVIVSDIVMPRMSGLGLLRWIQAEKPKLVPVLLFLTSNPYSAEAEEIGRYHTVLQKPCAPGVLVKAMLGLLRREGA